MFNSVVDYFKPTDKFYGNYRAVVVSTQDVKKAGRVQVKVYPMFEGVDDADLPWAIPADPFMGGTSNAGGLFIPVTGSHVWVFFEAGDHRFPVYWAGAPAISGGVPDQPQAGQTDYPYNHIFQTVSGHLIEIDDKSGNLRFHIRHPSGTDHLVGQDGTVTDVLVKDNNVSIGGNSNITITGNQNVTATGNINLTATGVITIEGSSVAIN